MAIKLTFEKLNEKYIEKLEDIRKSGNLWKKMMSNFGYHYNLGFFNIVCIFAQNEDTKYCASFNTWKSYGRFVKKGSSGLAVSYSRNIVSYVFNEEQTDNRYALPDKDFKHWDIEKNDDYKELFINHFIEEYNISGDSQNVLLDIVSNFYNRNIDYIDSTLDLKSYENKGFDIERFIKNSITYSFAQRCGFDFDCDFDDISGLNFNELEKTGKIIVEMNTYMMKSLRQYFEKNLSKDIAIYSGIDYNGIWERLRKKKKTVFAKKEDEAYGRDRLHSDRGLSISESDSSRTGIQGGKFNEVWIDETRLSVQQLHMGMAQEVSGRKSVELHIRHTETGRGDGSRTDREESQGSNRIGGNDGEYENRRLDVMGKNNDEDTRRSDIGGIEGTDIYRGTGHRDTLNYEELAVDDESAANFMPENNDISNIENKLTFAEQVDKVLNNDFNRYSDLKVCDTPQILIEAGLNQLPMLYSQRHLRDSLKPEKESGQGSHYHGLSVDKIKDIPLLLESPVMIYDSLSRNDSIVVVTSAVDNDNNPIIAIIKPDGEGKYNLEIVDSNYVLSVYGKRNLNNQIEKAIIDDKVIFADKEKSQELFSLHGLQLPMGFNNLGFNSIIHKSRNISSAKHNILKENDINDYNADNLLNKALKLINAYEIEEFNHEADFEDLSNIELAYTEWLDEDTNKEYSIQIFADLNNYSISTFIDSNRLKTVEYDSLEEFIENELSFLDFDSLVYISDEDIENIRNNQFDKTDSELIVTSKNDDGTVEEEKINTTSFEFKQLSLFDIIQSEGEQIGDIMTENSTSVSDIADIFISDKLVDDILAASFNIDSGFYNNDKARLYYAVIYPFDDEKMTIEYVKSLIVGRSGGFVLENGDKISAYGYDDGIRIAHGTSAVNPERIVSYEEAYTRIKNLIKEGKYITNNEIIYAREIYLSDLADNISLVLWEQNSRDLLSEESEEINEIVKFGNFPETKSNIKEVIINKGKEYEQIRLLLDKIKAIDSLPRYIWHNLRFLTERLDSYRNETISDYIIPDEIEYIQDKFIPDDVTNRVLCTGSGYSDGKFRIYRYFTQKYAYDRNITAAADFLKNEYGTGGHSGPGSDNLDVTYDAKGIVIRKIILSDNDTRVIKLNWSNVARIINRIIEKGSFFDEKALVKYNDVLNEWEDFEDKAKKPISQDEIDSIFSKYPVFGIESSKELVEIFNKNKDKSDKDLALFFSDYLNSKDSAHISRNTYDGLMIKATYKYNRNSDNSGFDEKYEGIEISRNMFKFGMYGEAASISYEPYEFFEMVASLIRNNHFTIEPTVDDNVNEDTVEDNIEESKNYLENDISKNVVLKNYKIKSDELTSTFSPRIRFRDNVNAIKLINELEVENRQPTEAEKNVLAKYVGWGGLSDAFDTRKDNWHSEYVELQELLSDSEYAAARESTMTAFYTSPVVINAMYKALYNMGFNEGDILEPACGIGNFIGSVPDNINATFTGVELDDISGKIAKYLYPESDIYVKGFEKTDLKKKYDVAIGNVPFGNFKIFDANHPDWSFSIHNYFFAKALENVHEGGLLAFITSSYTMDSENPDFRQYISERAEFLGAIRLPNTAFKGNAGTDVVSDIVFLKKRPVPTTELDEEFVFAAKTDNYEYEYNINQYFINHPEMVLGDYKETTGQYGRHILTVEPKEDISLEECLDEAIVNINGQFEKSINKIVSVEEDVLDEIPASPDIDNLTYGIIDDVIYYRQANVMKRVTGLSQADYNRLKMLVEMRQIQKKLINTQLQLPNDEIEAALVKLRGELNSKYDVFVKKYGYINSKKNQRILEADGGKYCLFAIENPIGDNKYSKADIFFHRTVQPILPVTSCDSIEDALTLSRAEKGFVDINYISSLTNKDNDSVINELINMNLIYNVPNTDEYQTADEYLSGNIRKKLDTAKIASESDTKYQRNVEALEKAMPERILAKDISLRLGSTWIPLEYYQQFMEEVFETPNYFKDSIKITYIPFNNEYYISNKNIFHSTLVSSTYGTDDKSAFEILEASLNLKDVKVTKIIETPIGTEKRVTDKEKTLLAQSKQESLKNKFEEWIWSDPRRAAELEELYNNTFNTVRNREYDGSFLTLPGSNTDIKLKDHQLNAVARIVFGGNTLLAHVVGAGKTFEMIAGAMESKRLGLSNKPMFVVPNHLTLQWASEFMRLYPTAKILVANKTDFEPGNRKKFCSRIAMGNYDAVIIGHSQFEKIPLSFEKQEEYINQEIEMLEEAITNINNSRRSRFASLEKGQEMSVKKLEKAKKTLKTRLEKLQNEVNKKQDNVVFFEQLGVDRLYVDEAHYYKNLYTYTKMTRVGGIQTTNAQKSFDMYMKTKYINDMTDEKGIIFATGTPISNSMVEMYTLQRYLSPSILKERGIEDFDSWASTFGSTVTSMELKPEGSGFQTKTRFAKFFNLPELMTLFKEFADVKTSDMLNLDVPEANYHNVEIEASEFQKTLLEKLSERAEAIRGGNVNPKDDNMLKITSDGRKLALDQRIVSPTLPDYDDSKINTLVKKAMNIYRDYDEEKATQLIFSDISTPSGDNSKNYDKDEFSNAYLDIKNKLIQNGVPESEIAFIHDANTELKKSELFEKVNKGSVRFLLGSTSKLGAGTNVQNRLIALHHLDVPWKPSDIEQQEGRIIRQGNMFDNVHIYRYITKGTFDAYSWQIIENKQKFISQIMTSKSPVRVADDIDETALSYAEIKALATGNPHIKEKMELDMDIAKLKMLQSNYLENIRNLKNKIERTLPKDIELTECRLKYLKYDLEIANKQNMGEFSGLYIGKNVYMDSKEAGEKLLKVVRENKTPNVEFMIGTYRGFELYISYEPFSFGVNDSDKLPYKAILKGATKHYVELGRSELGNIVRLDNEIKRIQEKVDNCEHRLAELKNDLELAKIEVEKPFSKEQELNDKLTRAKELEHELGLDEEVKENEVDDVYEEDIEQNEIQHQDEIRKNEKTSAIL